MADATPLTMQAGEPYARRLILVDGQDVWASLDDVEARMQTRSGPGETYPLRDDLTDFLTLGLSGNDITIDLSLTGADTRALSGGHYDLFLSDPGVTDVRALKIAYGRLTVNRAVTSAADA